MQKRQHTLSKSPTVEIPSSEESVDEQIENLETDKNSDLYIKLRKEHIEQRRLSDKSLLLGIEEVLDYKGHNGQPIITMIENHNNHLNVTFDLKSIHFWSMDQSAPAKMLKLADLAKSHGSISTVTYSHKYRVSAYFNKELQLYLVISTDFRFIFFNEIYNVVSQQDMSSIRLVNFAEFHDAQDLLITAGINGVFIFNFDYQSKYNPKLAAQVDTKGRYIKINLLNQQPLEKMLDWCDGLKVDRKSDLIITWNQKFISMNTLSTQQGRLVSQFKDLTEQEEKILDVLVFTDYRYFLTATSEGNIYIWKYVTTGKVETQRRLIHTMTGHFKKVTSICQFEKQPHLLLSVSTDGTAKVWSLDTFQHQYTFELPNSLNFVQIFQGAKIIVCGRPESIQMSSLHMVMENYRNIDTKVALIQPGYMTLEEKNSGQASFIINLCADNSAFINFTRPELSEKTTLYPPPSAQVIEKIVYSQRLDRFIVLLTNSTLCIYKKFKETALLEKVQDSKEVRDCENKPAFSQFVTCMELVQTKQKGEITAMDAEVLNHKLHTLTVVAAATDTHPSQEFVAMGLSKGSVIMLHMIQLDRVYSRFTIHRDEIKLIKYLPNVCVFVSFCREKYFKVWRCLGKERKPQVIYSFKLSKEIQNCVILSKREESTRERFLIIFKTGDTELFEFDGSDDKLYWLETSRDREHDCSLSGADFNQKLQLLVTSDLKGAVRVWNRDKKFLREIQLPNPVDSICFLNPDGDLLISHENRISQLNFKTYWTKIFDYFGITNSASDEYFQNVNIDKTSLYSDGEFIFEEDPIPQHEVESEVKLSQCLSGGIVSNEQKKSENKVAPLDFEKSEFKQLARRVSVKQSVTQSFRSAKKEVNSVRSSKPESKRVAKGEPSSVSVFHQQHQATNKPPPPSVSNEDSVLSLNFAEKRAQNRQLMMQLSPFDVSALPKSMQTPRVGIIQPLPGVSYLATSPTYYEMMARLSKTRKKGPLKSTRRLITENRICSNIMSYNQPIALMDSSGMEVSCDYHTQVSQSKYQLSANRVGSIYSQQPLPLEYLLNGDLSLLQSQIISAKNQQQEQVQSARQPSEKEHTRAKGSSNRQARHKNEIETQRFGNEQESLQIEISLNETLEQSQLQQRKVVPPSLRAVLSLEIEAQESQPDKIRPSETQKGHTGGRNSTPGRQNSHLSAGQSEQANVTGNDWNKDPAGYEARIETGDSLRPNANNTLLMEGDNDQVQKVNRSPPFIKEVKAQRNSEANNQILAEINTGDSSKMFSGSQGFVMSPVDLKEIGVPNLVQRPRLIQPNLTNQTLIGVSKTTRAARNIPHDVLKTQPATGSRGQVGASGTLASAGLRITGNSFTKDMILSRD